MARKHSVDWQIVQAELEEIGEVWKQARFDSLPHVVEILTSQVPEDAIQSLRQQRDDIEDIVDDVVKGYHNGFNKAFHNYSQILRVFSDSTSNVNGLKKDLDKAKELLGTRNKQLQQLWYRSLTIRHVLSLLDQIENASQIPGRIEKLIAEKQYYAAVQLYLQSTSQFDREGINGVGALQDVRSDLSKLRGTLFFKIVDELHLHIYNKGSFSVKQLTGSDADDDLSTIPAMTIIYSNGSQPISQRTRTRRSDHESESSSIDGREEEGSQVGDNHDSEIVGRVVARLAGNGLPSWLAESTPNEFVDLMIKNEAPLHVKYLQTLVECLALLGKIDAAGAILSQKLRPTIHELIIAEIKARAAAIEVSRPRLDQISKNANGVKPSKYSSGAGISVTETPFENRIFLNGNWGMRQSTGALPPFMGPLQSGQAAARDLLESVLRQVSGVLENHVIVGEMMEANSSTQNDATSPRRSSVDLNWPGDPDVARATGGYSLSFALAVIQSECQQLICDILRATPDAATADAAVQTARLASKLPGKNSSKNGVAEEGLSFAFRFTDTVFSTTGGDGLRQLHSRRTAGGAQEGYGTGAILPERGIYLIAAVYRPILQFTDRVLQLLPPKYLQLGNDGLQSFIENFVKDQFLPPIRVEYRNRVQDALASPAAFRPKSRTGILYESLIEKERPILQGPLAASQLVSEVVSWAQAMPKYASDFIEVAQALLERTLERCRATYTEAVLGSLSSSIVGRPEFENLMRQESASALFNALYVEKLDKKVSEEEFLDSEAMELEMEISNLLLSYRPLKQDQLISNDQKIVLLAALSDSLDYVSESLEKLGQNTSAFHSRKKNEPKQHQLTSSTLSSGFGALAEKYQSLSAECLRTLRIEMQLIALYHVQHMNERTYVIYDDAEEPEDFVISLTIQITRLDDEIMPFVLQQKRKYIFGGICGVVATYFTKALNEVGTINIFGIRQVCQNCIGVEQALAAMSSSNNALIQQRLGRVQTYYQLLNLPFEALRAYISEHLKEYSVSEFSSLLRVTVLDREVPLDAIQIIGEIIARGL